jgi:hypothetical protein
MSDHPVMIGSGDEALFGLLCEPANPAPGPVVVMLNAGLLHRAGPHRLWALLARQLADDGVISLRVDQNGVGDSPKRSGGNRQALRTDFREIAGFCQARHPGRKLVLLGLCSGADDALAVGHDAEGVAGMILLDGYAPKTTRYWLRFWLWKLLRPSAWLRLVQRVSQREEREHTGRPTADDIDLRDWPDDDTMMSRLRALVARRIPLLAVFTGSVRDYYSCFGQLGAALGRPASLTEAFLAHCNHLYEFSTHREELIGLIRGWVLQQFVKGN